jgi:hypothetical protein
MLTVVPSRRAANQRIDQRLAEREPLSGFASRSAWTHDTITLRELTARAYHDHPRPGRLLQSPAPRFLLAEILEQLEPEVRSLFGPGIGLAGTARAVEAAIAEIRQAGLSALDLAQATRGRRRLKALACVLDAYQRRLAANDWWDEADVLITATDRIRSGKWTPRELDRLEVAGLYDVTRLQGRLLIELARRATQTTVTVPFDPHHERLCAYAFPYIKMWEGVVDPGLAIDIEFLDGDHQSSGLPVVCRAADPADEATQVAEWVRDRAETGCALEEIGVVAAGGDRTYALLARELDRIGVRHHARRAVRLAETPFFGATLMVFRLLDEGFKREHLQAWVSTALTSGLDASLLGPALGSGPPASDSPTIWKRALAGIQSPSAGALNTALDQLHELATREHSPAAFWRKYERVLDVVGLSDTNLIPTPDRDRWEETIDQVRQSLTRLGRWHAPAVGWRTHRRHLLESLSGRSAPTGTASRGVAVLTPLDARALVFHHTAVMGLGEGAYARQRSATAVFGDGERESLNEQVGERVFRTATDEAREAMLLLTERVRVTPGDVMLSYAGQDDNGNPQLPAYALTAIEDELELEPPTTTESHSVPAWRRARSSNLIVHGQELERQRAVYFSQAADRRRGQGNAFDGQLSPTTVAELASELSDGRLTHWSASRLESWRQCPHQFFMRHVLRFYEPDEQPLEAEPTALGTVAHEALRRLYQENPALQNPGRDSIAAAVQEAGASLPGSERGDPAIWNVLSERVTAVLARYFDYLEKKVPHGGRIPVAFELSFGRSDDELPPVRVPTSTETVELSGRLDRLDRDPASGTLHVVDYKYSLARPHHKRAVDPAECGINQFQLYVYFLGSLAWAEANQMAPTPTVSGTIHCLREPRVLDEMVAPNSFEINEMIGATIDDAVDGGYDPSPADPTLCKWCDFRRACRIATATPTYVGLDPTKGDAE